MPDLNQLLDDVARFQKRIKELETQLGKALMGQAPAIRDIGSETIWIEGIVSHRDDTPKVTIRWGTQLAQMTTAEARAHAISILECADSAESDAFIVQFLKEKIGLEGDAYGAILQEFREFREKLSEKR